VVHAPAPSVLARATSPAWLAAAVAAPQTILLDHAHCEKKAASTAVGFLFRHPEHPRLCTAMSRLAREELLHFERVLGELGRRGMAFRKQRPSAYGAELHRLLRGGPRERLVDELLVSSLIEARSRERFALLAAGLPDRGLAALYDELGPSEERHAAVYVELAEGVAPAVEVRARLVELAVQEADIIARPAPEVRLHAG
jgi:tRNA-(ms[2]io[6]A)-hydroxylase